MDIVSITTFFAALIFAFMTFAHLVRIFKPFPVIIGSMEVPHWVSYIFVVVAAFISYCLFIAAGR